MASTFSMLSMLSKARRAANKRISPTDYNNSDSRSIASVSKEDKKAKKQSSRILRALEKSKEGGRDSLFPTTSSGLTSVIPAATTTSQPITGKPASTASVGTDELGFSVVPQQTTAPSFDFSSKARRILELCFFVFLSSLDTLAILQESELLST